ncbi:MAG: hypothetical protein EB078_04865, partial [Proteobacteria bacterium]|nr:hypothetical protein [Pseudomonadota bacterium]
MKTRFFLGEWRSGDKPVTPFEANELCQLAHARRKELESYPVDRVLSLLQDLGKLWSDPGFSLRQECEAELPGVTGFSEKMIRQSIASISRVLDRNGLERKLERELRGIRRGQWNSQPSSRTRITFQPLGVVLHILSGNVFLVGLSSLIEGLITGNITLLKQSSDEQFFLPRLIKSIESIDVDGVITRSIALVDYSSTDHGVIQVFKRSVDGIVVWGGEEAVQAYRNDLPARTKVIVYGPKLSLAIVTEKGLQEKTLPWISHQLAKEMAVWDQSACTAPQMVFIENERNVEPLGSSLVSALKNMETVLPAGAASVDTAIEIQKLRMVAEIAEIKNEGRCWGPENSISHTVYSSRDKAIEPSPLHRTIKICAFGTVKDILVQMEEMRGYLQTVGLGVAKSEVSPLASHLTQAGILRIVELGEMANGEIDDPHDGAFDLSQFGNFVFQRDRDEPVFWEERLGEVERKLLLEQKLREVVQIARSSSYYGPRLQGLVINSLVDLQKIPVLSRKDME